MSYKSPITIYEIQKEVSNRITAEQEEMVHVKVSQYIDVDKEELIKALKYDRDTYQKGYEDGKKDAVVHGHWVKHDNSSWACSQCNEVISMRRYMENELRYCSWCGTKMDERDGEQDGTD